MIKNFLRRLRDVHHYMFPGNATNLGEETLCTTCTTIGAIILLLIQLALAAFSIALTVLFYINVFQKIANRLFDGTFDIALTLLDALGVVPGFLVVMYYIVGMINRVRREVIEIRDIDKVMTIVAFLWAVGATAYAAMKEIGIPLFKTMFNAVFQQPQ